MMNGKNQTLKNSNSNLPNMSGTIQGWFLDITFKYVTRVIDEDSADFAEETEKLIKTKGVVRPPSSKDLKLMPEGAWAWKWLQIHCLPDVKLDTNQFVIYDGKRYKVMAKNNYSKYGYVRYTLLEAFTAENEGL